MNYKLIEGSLNDTDNPEKTILLNRGLKNWKEYLNINKSCVNDYALLENINDAVQMIERHVENNNNIHIVVDCDVDGYGSASMMYRYLKHMNASLNITYSLHTKKQHGLSTDIEIPDNCKLLIVPDAGSNDIKQCKELKEKGIEIIILDHHICDSDEIKKYAIVVNNQMCNYPNKNFCGAGIVYKVLQALDDELWDSYAEELLDICALCNISDVMDMREFETRYYTDMGLNKIRSKLFKALIEKQSYSMNNVVNIISVQFYVTPILNAMIRIGNQDEKDLLFRAFVETDEVFKHKKRGATEEIDENIYDRAARLCSNAKNRQSKEVLKGVAEIENKIKEKHLDENKVMFINVSDILNETLTGLVAIKIAEKYNHPCLLLRRQHIRDDGGMFYGGSCRNFDYSPIQSLKDFLDSTDLFEYVQGHDNAAGISISRNNVNKAIEECNEKLKDIEFSKTYMCDFDLDTGELDITFVKSIGDMKNLFCQGIKEPLIHVSDIPVYKEDTYIMGKELNTWKIIYNNDIAIVKFSVDRGIDQVINSFENTEKEEGLIGYIDIIGTASLNNYKGILTPQIIVKEYEFRKEV